MKERTKEKRETKKQVKDIIVSMYSFLLAAVTN